MHFTYKFTEYASQYGFISVSSLCDISTFTHKVMLQIRQKSILTNMQEKAADTNSKHWKAKYIPCYPAGKRLHLQRELPLAEFKVNQF